jgi:hypothetical protein
MGKQFRHLRFLIINVFNNNNKINSLGENMNSGMNTIFKLYDKELKSNKSDSVFSIIGRSEPALTKSLAFLLYKKDSLLLKFLELIHAGIDMNFIKVFVSAEQMPDFSLDNNRRDIAIRLHYDDPGKNTIIIIEAKNLYIKNINSKTIISQFEKYFDGSSYSDIRLMGKRIAVTLTKDKLKFPTPNTTSFNGIISITWQEIIILLEKFTDYLIQSYREEIMRSNFIKTYEEEVFCPPAGDSFPKIEKLRIYCCPADRSLKEAIYLLPRIPVNGNEKILTDKYAYNNESLEKIKGKGFSIALYKIETSFIVDPDSLDAIDNLELRDQVSQWGLNERLKVFVLKDRMEFKKPKITELQNNAWNGYFRLFDVWGNMISKNNK